VTNFILAFCLCARLTWIIGRPFYHHISWTVVSAFLHSGFLSFINSKSSNFNYSVSYIWANFLSPLYCKLFGTYIFFIFHFLYSLSIIQFYFYINSLVATATMSDTFEDKIGLCPRKNPCCPKSSCGRLAASLSQVKLHQQLEWCRSVTCEACYHQWYICVQCPCGTGGPMVKSLLKRHEKKRGASKKLRCYH
jgi:hypothetical protein